MYTLLLGGMYLAPRASIFVLEPNDLEDVGHGCDEGEERKITFTLYLKDDIFKTQIDALLAECDLGLLLKRRVKDEPWWQYNVKSGYTRRIQPALEYTQCGYTLAIELVLTLTSSSGVTPVILRMAIPRPDVIIDNALGMTPIPITITTPVPSLAFGVGPAASVLTVSIPVPALAMVITPDPVTMSVVVKTPIEGVDELDYIYLRDEKAQNTAGGTFTLGAWRTRVLNTEVEDTGGHCSLAANQFTLDDGTYRFKARAPAYQVLRHQLRLFNVTDTAVILTGSSMVSGSGFISETDSWCTGRFTIAAGKALELQHRCEATLATQGFGVESNFTTEIYAEVELWKEA